MRASRCLWSQTFPANLLSPLVNSRTATVARNSEELAGVLCTCNSGGLKLTPAAKWAKFSEALWTAPRWLTARVSRAVRAWHDWRCSAVGRFCRTRPVRSRCEFHWRILSCQRRYAPMVFGIIPECRSASLRIKRSASPESPILRSSRQHNRRPDEMIDPNKPHLNRRPGSGAGSASDGATNAGDSSDRPTLKRRPDDSSNGTNSSGTNSSGTNSSGTN